MKENFKSEFKAGSRIVYNDGRIGHTGAIAEVLSTDSTGMVVQFVDRADTTRINFADAAWMSFIKPVSYWKVRNTLAENESINVPANSPQEAEAFAASVLPHDAKWQAVRQLTAEEIAQLPIDRNQPTPSPQTLSNMKSNPRFVWNIGSIAEEYPDMPEQNSETVLWDRQEKKAVVTVSAEYAQAICLETTGGNGAPFTAMEKWFNSAGSEALESENIPATQSQYL